MSVRGLFIVGLLAAGVGLGAAVAETPEVELRTWVSRTALWPGDRVVYRVEIACAPRVELLVEDLAPERLRADGLDLVASAVDREVRRDGRTVYRAQYELVTYAVDVDVLRIGEIGVRYYRRPAGAPLDGAAPTGLVRVPPVTLAWRSTLPAAPAGLALRDAGPPPAVPGWLAFAAPLGWGLLLLSGVPVGLRGAALLRRTWPRRRRRRARSGSVKSALVALAAADVSDEVARRAAYGQLEVLLRQATAAAVGAPVDGLTGEEAARRLQAAGRGEAAARVAELLEECIRARYGGRCHLPSAARFAETVEAAAAVVSKLGLR